MTLEEFYAALEGHRGEGWRITPAAEAVEGLPAIRRCSDGRCPVEAVAGRMILGGARAALELSLDLTLDIVDAADAFRLDQPAVAAIRAEMLRRLGLEEG